MCTCEHFQNQSCTEHEMAYPNWDSLVQNSVKLVEIHMKVLKS
jgi:hypothetical protein